jgi:hypothetical protein
MRAVLGISPSLLRATSQALVLALGVTTLGPALHQVHDTACEPALTLHDESRHHFQAAPSTEDDRSTADHCVACHFVRTSRGPASWQSAGLHELPSGARLHHSHGHLSTRPSAAPTPARAPPLA